MKFKTLELYNYRQYRGTHKINLLTNQKNHSMSFLEEMVLVNQLHLEPLIGVFLMKNLE